MALCRYSPESWTSHSFLQTWESAALAHAFVLLQLTKIATGTLLIPHPRTSPIDELIQPIALQDQRRTVITGQLLCPEGAMTRQVNPELDFFFFFYFLARQFSILKSYTERNISFPPGKTLKP